MNPFTEKEMKQKVIIEVDGKIKQSNLKKLKKMMKNENSKRTVN